MKKPIKPLHRPYLRKGDTVRLLKSELGIHAHSGLLPALEDGDVGVVHDFRRTKPMTPKKTKMVYTYDVKFYRHPDRLYSFKRSELEKVEG